MTKNIRGGNIFGNFVLRVVFFVFLFFVLLFSSIRPVFAGLNDELVKTQIVKLAFIFRFVDYINFNGDSTGAAEVQASQDMLTMCLFGVSPENHQKILQLIGAEKLKKIDIVNKQKINSSKKCNIIYIDSYYQGDYIDILKYVADKPILTVSDIRYFSDNDGIVEFYNFRGKIRFFINNEAALKKNIEINAKLLELGGKKYD